jgi:hypothetical protein
MNFVVHVDIFEFSGDWVFNITSGLLFIIRITSIDIEPVTFKGSPILADLFIDIGLLVTEIISRESISWFSNFFMFNIVDSKSSITHILGLSPISVFRDTS